MENRKEKKKGEIGQDISNDEITSKNLREKRSLVKRCPLPFKLEEKSSCTGL